jgi:hypothetical protein
MFDRQAAIAAARKVLDNAPTLEGSDAPIFQLGELVDAVVAAANPDALIVPAYDAVGAPTANYPLLYVTIDGTPVSAGSLKVQASDAPMRYNDVVDVGMVELGLHFEDGGEASDAKAMLRAEGAYHFGLAMISASTEAHRIREARG